MKKIIALVILLSISILAQEGYGDYKNNFWGNVILRTGSGGSATDSSFVFGSSSGSPALTFYGTDGDAWTVGINTSDAATFTGAGGGYVFTGTISATVGSFTSTGATIITGSATATDSTTSLILKDSAGKKWKIRVYTNGGVVADSTGLN